MEITQDINCTEAEGCECDACVKDRADFDAWVADTDARWARAYAEGRVAHLCGNPCRNPLCPKSALTAPSGVVLEVVR